MVIELIEPTQEGYKPQLKVNKLAVGDYIVLAIDNCYREFPDNSGKGYGKSYLLYTDVYEFSFFDGAKRAVVDKKFPEPERVSWFCSESLWGKIEPFGIGSLVMIKAVETAKGKITYGVAKYDPEKMLSGSPREETESSSDEIEIKDVNLVTTKDGTSLSDTQIEELTKAIEQFKGFGFTNEEITNKLKDKYPEESIKELFKEE